MVDLNRLAQELHAAAVEKGFWDVEDALKKHVAKMHSELGEVIQADRAGIMYEVERDGAKPEGVVAELADFVMMMLDYIIHVMETDAEKLLNMNVEIDDMSADVPTYTIVNILHTALVNITRVTCKENILHDIMMSMYIPITWCSLHGYDLIDVIRAKMDYNRSRPKLHGRAY